MRDLRRHNRDDTRSVLELGAVIDADTAACDDFVGFELGFVNVRFDAFVRRNSHQMIAERAAGFFRGNDMLEFYPIESRMLGPRDTFESDCFARKPELALVEFFENIVTEISFFHDLTPMIVFRSRLLLTVSRLCPKSIRRGAWKNWTKLRNFLFIRLKDPVKIDFNVAVYADNLVFPINERCSINYIVERKKISLSDVIPDIDEFVNLLRSRLSVCLPY